MSALSEHVQVATADHVCTIRFHRAEKKNALTVAMYETIVSALRTAQTDEDVRVVRFIGTAGVFTAGNDLADFMLRPPVTDDTPVFQLLLLLTECEKPMVAAVDGPAIGLGTTLLLHCDLVVATDRARFQLPFVRLGLVPEAASSVLLPAIVGMQRAAEWLMLGEPFGAAEAHAAGLVNRVVSPDDLEEASLAFCRKLADQPQTALRQTRALLRGPQFAAVRDALRREGDVFRERLQSAEAAQAFAAFFQRK